MVMIWKYHSPKFNGDPIGSIGSKNEDSFGNMWFGTIPKWTIEI